MHREQKRRKFHEALLNTLYPPASQPQLGEDEHSSITTPGADFDVNLIPDDYGMRASISSKSDDDDGESDCESLKLSRAQRKRLRKKKLKEDISRRKQIIGPLLPLPSSDRDGSGDDSVGGSAVEQCTPTVRQNARDRDGVTSSQSKLQQRRIAKRLAKERLKPADCKDCVQNQSSESITGENCDQTRKFRSINRQNSEDDNQSSG